MKLAGKSGLLVVFLTLIVACSSKSPLEPEIKESSNKDLIRLVLEFDETEYPTNIGNVEVVNNEPLPYLADEVTIKSFQVSSGATANISVGQSLKINESPFMITVSAQDASSRNYSLVITKDQGRQIEPNASIESGSSYSLQSSDVYVDAAQLSKDFERSGISTYADFNNDGHTDVIIALGLFKSHEYSPIELYLGDGTGVNPEYCECGGECSAYSCSSFERQNDVLPSDYEGLQHPRKIIIGDFNNDQLMDAFIIGHGYDDVPFPGESPVLILNQDSGFDYQKLTNVSGFYHGGSAADFDNDGDIDIFINGSPSDISAVFLINDGAGNFTQSVDFIDVKLQQSTGYYTSEFIDVNEDGFIDLLIAGHEDEGAETLILWGNSSGTYYKDLSVTLPEVAGFNIVVDIEAFDIDGDGDRDIILNRVDSDNFYENYFIQIIENQDNTGFKDVTSSAISNNTGNHWYIWIHPQDLNNDGNMDLYLEMDHRPNLKWFGDGNGKFYQ